MALVCPAVGGGRHWELAFFLIFASLIFAVPFKLIVVEFLGSYRSSREAPVVSELEVLFVAYIFTTTRQSCS